MNRRDLLKFFGAGAVVAPIVNGLPAGEAIIVQPPTVELPPEPRVLLADTLPSLQELQVVVFLKDRKGGGTWRMDCDAFMASATTQWRDLTSAENPGPFRKRVPIGYTCSLEISGPARWVEVPKR